MTWTLERVDDFQQFRHEWDALNGARGNHILLDSAFVSALLRYFPEPDIHLAVGQQCSKPAMALLVSRGHGAWETFQPSQAPLGLVVVEQRDEDGAVLRDLLRGLPGVALQVGALQQDPDYSAWPSFADEDDLQSLPYIETGRVPLNSTFEEYWNSRSSNLKHNVARQRRRLEEEHQLTFRAYSSPEEMAEGIQQYARLESAGWKAQLGTAIQQDTEQGQFYRAILEEFARRDEARIYELRVDDRVVASDLCLKRGPMLIVLKTTYDETMKPFSPALHMRQEEIRHLYACGDVSVIEFYGRAMDWHKKWTSDIRTMYHLNCYRNQWVRRARNSWQRLGQTSQRGS